MPTYCYSTNWGDLTVERVFAMGKAPKTVTDDDGRLYFRDIRAEHVHAKSGDPWPLVSDALGVPPDQVKETQQELAKSGVDADFTSEGGMIIRSRQHRNQVLAAYGMYDKDAGYGDKTKGN